MVASDVALFFFDLKHVEHIYIYIHVLIHTLYTWTRRYELYCIDVYDISYTSTIILDASFLDVFCWESDPI